MARPARIPRWFLETALVAIGANLLATSATTLTIDAMGGVSDFARESRVHELALLPWVRVLAYGLLTPAVLVYLWPIVGWLRAPASAQVPAWVQRRVVSAPLVVALLGFMGWVGSIVVFPLATLLRTGRWSPDLMSQQVLSPLVNGFLAATSTYLLVDLVFRRRVVPLRLSRRPAEPTSRARWRSACAAASWSFSWRSAFVPLFTLFGLVRAAVVRLARRHADRRRRPAARARERGVVRALPAPRHRAHHRARPHLHRAARRAGERAAPDPCGRPVGAGRGHGGRRGRRARGRRQRDGRARCATASASCSTFGRVVDPAVRDRLLAGELEQGGELRTATVLFSDLRDFTALAAHAPRPRSSRR